VATARNRADVDAIVESNREFHLQIARMAHNGEFESVLRGVLERGTRLIYLVVRSSAAPARDAELLLKPIVQAIRARDAKGAHEAVIHDITRGQMNLFGRDMWAAQPGRVAKRTQKEE
jgi:DNA-binding GntR family transcriptional regulator